MGRKANLVTRTVTAIPSLLHLLCIRLSLPICFFSVLLSSLSEAYVSSVKKLLSLLVFRCSQAAAADGSLQ